MAELLVMRHAKSAWDTGDADFFRPLNGRGERAAQKMAAWVRDNDLVPDRVLASPAERAKTTAMAVVYECGIDPAVVDFDNGLYLAGAQTWLDALRGATAERLLICGHNPGLDDLVEYLSADPLPLSASGKLMTTAAIAHFAFDVPWSEVGSRLGRLVELVRPRDL